MGKRRLNNRGKLLATILTAVAGFLGIKTTREMLNPSKNHTPLIETIEKENPDIKIDSSNISYENFFKNSDFMKENSEEISILDKVANGDAPIDDLNKIDNELLIKLLLSPAKQNISEEVRNFMQEKQNEGQEININLDEFDSNKIMLQQFGEDTLQIHYGDKDVHYVDLIDCSKMYDKNSKEYQDLLKLTKSVGNIELYDAGTKNEALKASLEYMIEHQNRTNENDLAYVDTSNSFKDSIRYDVNPKGDVAKLDIDYDENYQYNNLENNER